MTVAKEGHHLVFPIQKCGFLSKVKKIKRLCGGVVYYAAQASARIDAEIGQKDHLWMETNSLPKPLQPSGMKIEKVLPLSGDHGSLI
jgi:hypothetical protein